MLARIKDWFFDHQLKLATGLGVVSAAIVFWISTSGGLAALGVFLGSLVLIYAGDRVLQPDTSENWLSISWGALIRNVFGCVLMMFGWVILLRGPFAWAIAAIFLRTS